MQNALPATVNRDRAIAEFFEELTKILKQIAPLIAAAVKERS